jgi:hypothetical protein
LLAAIELKFVQSKHTKHQKELRVVINTAPGLDSTSGLDSTTRMSCIYEVSLGEGPLGLSVTNNTAGNRLSAVVDKVSGQAEAAAEIYVAHLLISINGQSTTEMSFTDTLNLLNAEQEKRCAYIFAS